MPTNWTMFKRRADLDPEASKKRGMAKTMAGWKLMLRDEQQQKGAGATKGRASSGSSRDQVARQT
jgi:hypothetical protein